MSTSRRLPVGSRGRSRRAGTLDATSPVAHHGPGGLRPLAAPWSRNDREDAVRALAGQSAPPWTTTEHGSWSLSRNASASGHSFVTRRARLISDRDGSDFSGTTPRGEGQAGWQPTPRLDTVSSTRPRASPRRPVVQVPPEQRERSFLALPGSPTQRSLALTTESSTR